jgi:DNA-binding CsgD family transcriptional regulator
LLSSEGLENRILTPAPLPPRQMDVLRFIVRVHDATGEGCTATLISKRLKISRERARAHIATLYRKGWLKASGPPAIPKKRQS